MEVRGGEGKVGETRDDRGEEGRRGESKGGEGRAREERGGEGRRGRHTCRRPPAPGELQLDAPSHCSEVS